MKDSVRVKITGLNLLRIIDKLVENGVIANNLVIKGKTIIFSIESEKLEILNKICKKEHKFYVILQKNGIKQTLSKLPYMFGFALALILSTIYIYSYSLFVSNIDLSYSSNFDYDLTKISKILDENGVTVGMKKNKYKISEIQNIIMLGVDDVEGCQVRLVGEKLNICIFPAVKKYEISTENIVSKYDAVVEYAEAFSGKLAVKNGDVVRVGDVLIENDNGASGTVTGKVYFSATKIYNENQQKITFTGRVKKLRDFVIFDKFTIFDKNLCDFKQYEVENCTFFVNKNLFFPIKCNEKIYKEIQIENVTIPFSSVEEKVKAEAFSEAKSKITDENSITNVTYSIVTEKNYTRVDCFIETKINLF